MDSFYGFTEMLTHPFRKKPLLEFFFLIYSASGTIGIQYLVSYKKRQAVSEPVLFA